MKSRTALFGLATVLAIAVLTPTVYGARPELLHPRTGPVMTASSKPRVAPKRSQRVTFDRSALVPPTGAQRGKPARVQTLLGVRLFPDVWLPVALDEYERDLVGNDVWTGAIEGEYGSHATIAIHGDAMAATFVTRDRHYAVRPLPGGELEVIEIDAAAYPAEAEPIAVASTAATGMLLHRVAVPDSTTTLWDVLVAYTHIVRTNYGSASAVKTLIANAIAATNQAYTNSAVSARVRLVGTVEVTYDDQTATFSTTLSRLRNTSDGFMDSIHTTRNSTGADEVALLVWNPTDGACGLAYLMTTPSSGFASSAFSVIRDDCAVDNLSFPHELGHNFGLAHDRANASVVPSYSYAYGYQDTSNLFRDIMAYDCPVRCPRIRYFSNPDVLYNGRPTGVNHLLSNSADNARALNNSASIIAGWRGAVFANVTFTDDPLIAGTTTIKAVHLTELRTAVNSVRGRAGLPPATWTDTSLAGLPIKAVHIMELRNALTPALTELGTTPVYTDATIGAGLTVRAVHLQELRNYTK